MTLHISPAIIMRTREFGESDLMVSFFTAEEGRLKGVAKGARRSRQRFANCLDLFCLTRLEYERRREEGLYFFHSGKLIEAFPGLRSDFLALSLASYMIELTEMLFPMGVSAKRMFDLMYAAFSALNQDKQIDGFRILFEAKAMALGGYAIDLSRCCVCGRPYQGQGRAAFQQGGGGIACLKCRRETRKSPGLGPGAIETLNQIQSTAWETFQAQGLSAEMIREIKPVLKRHIEYRIGRRLKSAEYLEGTS